MHIHTHAYILLVSFFPTRMKSKSRHHTLYTYAFPSVQVMASAGAVTVRFLLQSTHSSRYVPIIVASLNNKSKDIRRATCEYLHLILQSWQTIILQKHVNILQEAIKKGMADSDVEARAFARKFVSFYSFSLEYIVRPTTNVRY